MSVKKVFSTTKTPLDTSFSFEQDQLEKHNQSNFHNTDIQENQESIKLDSLIRQNQIKLHHQKQYFLLRETNFKEQIEELKKKIVLYEKVLTKKKTQKIKQYSIHCELCSDGQVIQEMQNKNNALQQQITKIKTEKVQLQFRKQSVEKKCQQLQKQNEQLKIQISNASNNSNEQKQKIIEELRQQLKENNQQIVQLLNIINILDPYKEYHKQQSLEKPTFQDEIQRKFKHLRYLELQKIKEKYKKSNYKDINTLSQKKELTKSMIKEYENRSKDKQNYKKNSITKYNNQLQAFTRSNKNIKNSTYQQSQFSPNPIIAHFQNQDLYSTMNFTDRISYTNRFNSYQSKWLDKLRSQYHLNTKANRPNSLLGQKHRFY